MKRLKILLQYCPLAALLCLIACSRRVEYEPGKWMTDFEQARAVAREKKMPILVAFTGSDWCHWCVKMDKEIFLTGEFSAYARENLVLVVADFPARRKLPAKIARQNDGLSRKYGVKGIPINLFIDEKGNELGRMKYEEGGAEKYIGHIRELLKKNEARGGSSQQ